VSKLRVLISENSQDYAWLLANFLAQYPEIEIVGIACDGKQTMDLMEQTDPEIVILDLVMPEMDGIEVLKRIQRLHSPISVYVISAIRDDGVIGLAQDLGAKCYFVKPFDFTELAEAVLHAETYTRSLIQAF